MSAGGRMLLLGTDRLHYLTWPKVDSEASAQQQHEEERRREHEQRAQQYEQRAEYNPLRYAGVGTVSGKKTISQRRGGYIISPFFQLHTHKKNLVYKQSSIFKTIIRNISNIKSLKHQIFQTHQLSPTPALLHSA